MVVSPPQDVNLGRTRGRAVVLSRGMDIVCKRCAAAIDAADVNLDSRLAKCRQCNAVFDFTAQLGTPGAAPLGRLRAPVPLPAGLEIVEDQGGAQDPGDYRAGRRPGGKLVIARRWFSAQLYFMLVFCIFWDGFLFNWYASAGKSGSLMMILFPLMHVGVGVSLTYHTIAGFLNRTWITATPTALTIRHAPLPWRGNRTLAVEDIEQLYCKQGTGGSRDESVSYTLAAAMKDGTQLDLIKGLPQADQALFIEQRVEERLGIVDAPVGGEYAA